MKKLLSAVLVFGLLLTATGCGSGDKGSDGKKEKLVVLTNSGYPPYEVLDEDGNLSGFDIDLMNELAKVTGYEVEIKDVKFDAIVASVKAGKADIGIAGITPSKDRKKSVDFSDVYYSGEDSQNYLLYKTNSGIETQDDLKGKKIGCQMGTVQYEAAIYFQDNKDAKVDAKDDYASIVAEINKGNNDAAIVEKAVAFEFAQQDPEFKYFKLEGLAALEGNAMAFKKGSPLVEEFNKGIQELKDNGTLDKLIKKYFNKSEEN